VGLELALVRGALARRGGLNASRTSSSGMDPEAQNCLITESMNARAGMMFAASDFINTFPRSAEQPQWVQCHGSMAER
jgi:hypothetical protein